MDKRTILVFVGGELDGLLLDSANDKDPYPEVTGLVAMLGGAQIGQLFPGGSKAAMAYLREHGPGGNPGFKAHVYTVTGRHNTEDVLTITFTYSGTPWV